MSATSPVQRGWTSPRVRRARMFAVLLGLCAVAGLWSVNQPWFAWATPGIAPGCSAVPAGSPTITVQTADGRSVSGIAARGCISGAKLVQPAVSSTGTPAGTSRALGSLSGPYNRGTPQALLGLPRAATIMVGCLLLAVFAVATRRGYLGVPALLVQQIAHQDLGSIRTLYLSGAGTNLTVAQGGLQWFTLALLAGSALTLTATIFVLKVNFEQRAENRSRARADGAEAPRELTDPIADYLGRKMSRVKQAAEAEMRAAVPS